MSAEWTKRPAIQSRAGGCLSCGVPPETFRASQRVSVGFGIAQLTKDSRAVWDAGAAEYDECITGADAEALALADPDHDWRIVLDAPLSSRVYQRHGPGLWALVEQGPGFA